ncbi:hypothetical protein GCM10027578_27650 [Spirosoma luteolum]
MVVASTVGFAQASTSADFFVGKWKATHPAGPQAGPGGKAEEITLWIDIAKKEGKLTVHLSSENIINVRVLEERATALTIVYDMAINPGFPTQQITARDVHAELVKVDDDTLNLEQMGAQLPAKRVK